MKKLKPILIMTLVSAFAVLTVVNMNLAKPKVTAANTLDMLEIMTRAFDESEGGEGGEAFFCYTDLQLQPWPTPKIQFCKPAPPNTIPQYICGGEVRAVRGPLSERESCSTPAY